LIQLSSSSYPDRWTRVHEFNAADTPPKTRGSIKSPLK